MLTGVNQILTITLNTPCGRLLRPLFFTELDRLRADTVRQREERRQQHAANPAGAAPPPPTPKEEAFLHVLI
jgi:hypothetical protein